MATGTRAGLSALLAAWLTSGCTVLGPDYERPDAPLADEWLEVTDPRVSDEPRVDPRWWQAAFQDPDLDALVEEALAQSLTLRSAGLRVLQAQQQLAIAIGDQYPQNQQLSGSAARARENGRVLNDYAVGFNLSWELDFWGRFRRQIESAQASLDASVADYDGALVSLVSQVAQTYILIRTTRARIEVAKRNVDLQAESLRIALAKQDAGEVSELDADQARTLLNNTRASVASLEISLQQFKNALAVLLGKPPQSLNDIAVEVEEVPSAPAAIAVGMPQDLIRRRPDIRVAERRLAAQSAQIGFAEADLYPQFVIGGSIGSEAFVFGDLLTAASRTWDLFGAFQWNIFNYGRLQSNVRLQDARFQQLLVDYRNVVLQAQGDVENSIVAYLKSQEQLDSFRLAAEASRRAVEVSTAQYRSGLVDFNTVLSTLTADTQQQDQYTAARGTVATNLVAVYLALGGGWEIRDGADPAALLPAATKNTMRERTERWNEVFGEQGD